MRPEGRAQRSKIKEGRGSDQPLAEQIPRAWGGTTCSKIHWSRRANAAQAEIAPPAANPSNISLGCPRAGKDLAKTFPEGILQQGSSHCSTGTEESPRVPSGQDNALSCPDCSEAEHPGQETGEEKQSPWLSGAALKALPRFGNSGSGWRHTDASPGLVPGAWLSTWMDVAGGLWALGGREQEA